MRGKLENSINESGNKMNLLSDQFNDKIKNISGAVSDQTGSLVSKIQNASESFSPPEELGFDQTDEYKQIRNDDDNEFISTHPDIAEGKEFAEAKMNDLKREFNNAKGLVSDSLSQAKAVGQKGADLALSKMNDFKGQLDNANGLVSDSLSQAKAVGQKGADFLKKQLKIVNDILDEFDNLTIELEHLTKESADGDDEAEASSSKIVDAEENIIGKSEAHILKNKNLMDDGIDLLIQRISDGAESLDESCLKNMMGSMSTRWRLNLFLRHMAVDGLISNQKMHQFLKEEAVQKKNVGIAVAALSLAMLSRLASVSDIPNVVQTAFKIVKDILDPMVTIALSFGVILALEDLKELVKDDPAEIAAAEALADEEAMERRMELLQAFASDFQDCVKHGHAPDPSLMIAIAVEVSTSFIGAGPTTQRRIALLMSIMQIANVEPDKKSIDELNEDLHKELLVIQSLQAGANTASISSILDSINTSFDARSQFKEASEIGEFWVLSFGKETHDVPWDRFRFAMNSFYGKSSDKILKKIKIMLIDLRGNVTIELLKKFTKKYGGSLKAALKTFSKLYLGVTTAAAAPAAELAGNESPTNIIQGLLSPNIDTSNNPISNSISAVRPKTTGGMMRSVSSGTQSPKNMAVLSPEESRHSKLRLYGHMNLS